MPPRSWTYSLPAALMLMAPFDLLASLAMDAYLPAVPVMPAALATTPSLVQLTLSLYLLLFGSGQLIFGPLSDRIGRRPVLLGGALVFIVASAGLALTASGPLFLALRVAEGLGAAAALVAIFATVRDVYATRPEGTTIYALLGGMLAFVPALGPLLGAAFERAAGWRGIFAFLALGGALAAFQILLRWPETRPLVPRGSPARMAWTILGTASFRVYTLGFGTAMGAFFVYFSIAARLLEGRLGLSPIGFALVFGTVALVMIATARLAPRAVLRWGERGCLGRGMALLLAGAALEALAQIMVFPSAFGFVAPVWVMAVGIAITCAVTANGALRPFPEAAGLATALHSCLEGLFVAAAGTLAVELLPAETGWPLVAFCAVAAFATLVLLARLTGGGAR